jgi:ankyrin repeat protein
MYAMRRATINFLALFAGLAAIAAPSVGQGLSSKGDEFLAALRESNGSKAFTLLDGSGTTIINHRGDDGATALHLVIRARNTNWIGYLLANGADKDAADKKGDTPLILAARTGYGEAISRLLKAGAMVDKANRQGETPLIVAVQQRQTATVGALLELGADPDKRDHAAGYSAREYAARDSRSKDMIKLIEAAKPRPAAVPKPAS